VTTPMEEDRASAGLIDTTMLTTYDSTGGVLT
jgi:hypothetical protein